MQLQRGDRQNLVSRACDSSEESLECKETLVHSLPVPSQNNIKYCCCRCSCGQQELPGGPVEKRRQKRKESKRRQKERQREVRETALVGLERIIRDIYGLRVSFKKAHIQIEECLSVEHNQEQLCEFINIVIRDEVEFIRRDIGLALSQHEDVLEGQQHAAIRVVFAPILRIAAASSEIQKLINVFMTNYSDGQETPLQKNFGRTTLKFLVKVDLYKSNAFSRICSYIFQAPPELYPKERELVNYMMSSFENPNHLEAWESDDDTQECFEDEDGWEEEGSTTESLFTTLTVEEQDEGPGQGSGSGDRGRRRRRQRRRQLCQDIESTFEAILKRTGQMRVDDQERTACHVSEQFLVRMSHRKWNYTCRMRPGLIE